MFQLLPYGERVLECPQVLQLVVRGEWGVEEGLIGPLPMLLQSRQGFQPI
jgi:hypothetical protein